MPRTQREVAGRSISITTRTYYGVQFHWLEILDEGEWISTGDPWQGKKPTRNEIIAAVKYLDELHSTGNGQILSQFI